MVCVWPVYHLDDYITNPFVNFALVNGRSLWSYQLVICDEGRASPLFLTSHRVQVKCTSTVSITKLVCQNVSERPKIHRVKDQVRKQTRH